MPSGLHYIISWLYICIGTSPILLPMHICMCIPVYIYIYYFCYSTRDSSYLPLSAQKSPTTELNNKSPGSSSSSSTTSSSTSSSSTSQFCDNGSIYDFVIDIAKRMDLVKRHDDSDSEGSEKVQHRAGKIL